VRDLLIITPTRGRPHNAQRLAEAVAATATACTDLVFAVDHDDASYDHLSLGARMIHGPGKSCPAWSNEIAAGWGPGYRAVASLGDDHLPRTPGWDTLLLAAIDDMGGTGIAYGDDIGQGENLPTAPVISADIVAALGWFFLPSVRHLFADNVWLDLGREAGCLRYVPEVVVEHLHYSRGESPRDATYDASAGTWEHDEAAYQQWRRDQMAADVAKIRALRKVTA
jgi:hypothetical protein